MMEMKKGMTPEQHEAAMKKIRDMLPPGVQMVVTEQQDFTVTGWGCAVRC